MFTRTKDTGGRTRVLAGAFAATLLTALTLTSAPSFAGQANVDELIGRANAALNSGKTRDGIRLLTQAIEATPNDADLYLMRARGYTSDGDYARALADCSRAIELKPNDPEMYLARARAYRADDRFQDALNDVEKAVSLDPNNPDVYLSRADIHVDMGNDAAAKADEAKAAELERAAR